LITESLLLATIGGLLGLALAAWGLDALVAINPANIPRLTGVGVNAQALMFTLVVSVATALIFGLVPAWQATRGALNQTLRDGGRGAAGNVKSNRLRATLVGVEVALSVVVLIGAGLLIKSLNRLLNVESGFRAENLLTANLPLVEFKDPQRRASLVSEVTARVAAIPGVQVVSGGSALPPINAQRATRFAVQGLSNESGLRTSYFITVCPDYFRALGTRVSEGREFTPRDLDASHKVVIINHTMARALYPNESAIGKRLQIVNSEHTNEWREIVGVVGDVRYSGLEDTGEAAIYTPFAQTPFLWTNLMIRTSVPPETMAQSVRNAITSVNTSLQASNFRTMDQLVSDSVARPRFNTILLAAFASLALALAAVGIYGVIAYSVTQRTQEIGVRMALGARSRNVVWLVLKQGMTPAFIGALIGLGGAWGMTRLISSLLFEVSPTDPAIFAAGALLLMMIAMLACYIPARRATKVDPMIALRCE
jgi:putative ABC transport system permease protein